MNHVDTSPEFEALLDYLKRTHGFDFAAYKRSSLLRRITKRMETIKVHDFSAYLDYLEVHPDEFPDLFNSILINVTSFFRDAPAWEFIASTALPRLLESKEDSDTIRVWSAGCASGEEAYSVAMLLCEALGPEQFKERVKIYATDVDEDALSKARLALYTAKDVEEIPPAHQEKYFERTGDRFAFRKDLRRFVIFGRHDLIQDAPISRLDLMICRNTLMYFNSDTQARILARFHFSVLDYGLLFLGKAEMLLTQTNAFSPLDIKWRVFSKLPHTNMRDRLLVVAQGNREASANSIANHVRMRELAFDTDPVAQIVVDMNGHVMLANERARLLFNLSPRDLLRPLQDLELSYRPADLRTLIDTAHTERRIVALKEVEWRTGNDSRWLDISGIPLLDGSGVVLGVKIAFSDVSTLRKLQTELHQSKRDIETAYEELQSTNEELETTNEELQSTIEELETTNEELQSTNEELETMNEELQSTNEELETVNSELNERSEQLNQANSLLGAVLTSFPVGVIAVDENLKVLL
jgi:two-component system CheB/CheR fusion protein